MADAIVIALAIVSVVALGTLAWWRWSLYGLHRQADRRLLLADVVLVVGALEILFDGIADVLGPGPTHDALHTLSIVCRGGFAAGALTLVITFPADARRERVIRRIARTTRERNQ